MSSILITGGTGYLGRAIVRHLLVAPTDGTAHPCYPVYDRICSPPARSSTSPRARPRRSPPYGVLAEEVAEYFDEVRKREKDRDPEALRRELMQIAAVAIRAMVEL